MAGGPTAILDLLFDRCDGVLKEDVPEIQSLDFTSLGLMGGEFDDLLFDGALLGDEKQLSPQISYTDHDYVMQPAQSPASSDSGVSVESNEVSSPKYFNEDISQMSGDINSISGSPQSVSQYSPRLMGGEISPRGQDDQLSNSNSPLGADDPLGMELENFDFGDMNFDTIDSSALMEEGSFKDTDLLDENVSIDLSSHTDLMTFGTTTNTALNIDGTETRTIKIIKVSAPPRGVETLPFTMKDVSTGTQMAGAAPGKFPELYLTEEERDLLSKEGVSLPTDMPLTKEEERALKAVRRKIRNKISAKESRKRKMGYVDGLEKRVKLCTSENQQLKKKVEAMEKQNMTLMGQMKKLQALISIKSTRSAQASTCVMVLLLSFAFLMVPNFNPFRDHESIDEPQTIPLPGKSRNLLHKPGDEVLNYDTENPYGITIKPAPFWENPPKTPAIPEFRKGEEFPVDDSTNQGAVDSLNKAKDNVNNDPVNEKKENVIYVQIEKTVEESNVTFVSTEAEFKGEIKSHDQTGNKQGEGKKHDL